MSQLAPLRIYGVNNTTSDVITSNLLATLERGYKPFSCSEQKKGPVSIVGAGPSLSWTYQDLVGDVIACNSAHDFLISKGIIPTYAMLWDAHPIMEKVITPHLGVKYLIASRCHPSLFKKFEGFDVTVWHAMGSDGIDKMLEERGLMEPLVAGGSSSVTRATHLAGSMGYTSEMHLFGIDSSYSDNGSDTHVAGSVVDQQSIKLRVCGEWFKVAPWMAMQAGDFKLLVPILQSHGVKIIVHGTGLIPYVATFLGCETPNMKVSIYERYIKRPLHSVISLFLELRATPQLLGGN